MSISRWLTTRRRSVSVPRRPRLGPLLDEMEIRLLLSGPPTGDLTEGNASSWGTFASDNAASSVTNETARVKVGTSSVRFDTASGFDTGVKYPAGTGAHLDLTAIDELTLWVYGINTNNVG